MTSFFRRSNLSSRQRGKVKPKASRQPARRQSTLECLESRTLLSYTFTGGGTNMGVATGDGNADTLYLEPFGGLIYHSTDGTVFSPDWGGGLSIAASTANTISVLQGNAANAHAVVIGGVLGPVSNLKAHFNINDGGPLDSLVVDDSQDTQQAIGVTAYTVTSNSVTGPPTVNVSINGPALGAGLTLLGGTAANTFDVNSTLGGEPVNVITGAGTTSIVNVAPSGINSAVAIYGASASSATTLNVNDASDTTSSTATLDNLSGNASAPFEVTGLSAAPIEYGPAVTALNIFGGTSSGGTAGVTYDVYNTQAGTTTTINGGSEHNHYQLSDQHHTGGLSNILGPMVINAGNAADFIELDDIDNNASDNYTVTSTTVTSTGPFGGLTYGGLGAGGTLELDAQNYLGTNGNNIIDINSTADGIQTNVNGYYGNDVINVNGTGTGGALAISTGDFTAPSSTVNVLANNEPVSIDSFTISTTITTVNIGSTGGPGSMADIKGPISVVNSTAFTSLNLHDENDTTSSTATLDNASGKPSAPFQVTGLSSSPVEYGRGVTALNINGGTSGANGVTYDINNTQAGTTTTINGGPNQNSYNLANSTLDLSNLPGPVVVNGGGAGDQISVDDSNSTANDDYTVTDTTVTSTGAFGGLTYGGLGAGALTLDASQGDNVIDVDNTADGVNTSVFSESGTDTININGTGTGASVNVTTGDLSAQSSTVNVIVDNEQVNIGSFASAPDTVNIGSRGGPGSMAEILGPISISNTFSHTSHNFPDENDSTGQTWTLDNDDSVPTGTVAVTGSATTTYNPFDLSDMTINGGSGGNTFVVNATSANYPTTLNTGTGDDTVNVFSTGDNTLNIQGQDGTDSVTLGASTIAPLGMQGLAGTINVDNTLGSTDLVLDDSADTVGQTAELSNDGTTGTVTGLSPATINYTNSGTDSLTVFASNAGGNTFTVNGTLVNPSVPNTLTTINKGTGSFNSVTVSATNAGSVLDLTGGASDGSDTVDLIENSPPTILGTVNVDEVPGSTNLVINLTNDGLSHDFVLFSDGTTSTLHDDEGNFPDFTYMTSALASLTIDTDPAFDQTLNVDFGGVMPGDGFNPIPSAAPAGLIFNADGDGSNLTPPAGTHALNLFGELVSGPFGSETHNANDQTVFPQVGQYGSIFFTDAAAINTGLDYTGLQPITDTTPAIDYTFNDFGYPDQSFSATTGPIVGGFQTIEFASTPTPPFPTNFETTDIANKNFVTFNTPPAIPPIPNNGVIGTVNIPTPSDGLLSLTFNTFTGGTDTVSFVNTPPGVVTSYNDGAGPAITDVTGLGVADGTVLFLNGGAGFNTLDYDAGGEVPTITPGLLPGEVLITIPGAGVVDAINYNKINITDLGPLVITPGPAVTINTVEDFQNVDSIVGTFTAPILPFPGPPGFPASDFTASIDWGDPSPDPDAGTITQDASDPSVYYITGTHTFLENGTYTVANTVAFAGGTYTAPVNGVPITFTFGPAGPTPGTDATANVVQGPLAVSAFPVVGTEGIAIPAGPIATFIDAGGADAIANYSASISIFDSGGNLVVGPLPAASITQNGNAAQFTVNAPSFLLPEEGTYQVVVSVTDSGGTTPITVSGASHAVIADAALTPEGPLTPTGNTGILLSGTEVGMFTDGNVVAPASDFTGTIDWGDGSPNSVASFLADPAGGGLFHVFGSHTYAKPGVYTVTTNVFDVGGSTTTLISSFTISDLSLTGATKSFTAVEGQNTGLFVLATFEDPNTLATVADVHAELAVGGWGDGTPGTLGVDLTIQQTGVDPTNGEPTFEVLGSHTYAEETPPGLPNTLTVIIQTSGSTTTILTSPPGGGVTVLDAKLTGSSGNSITGVEGSSTGTVLLGSFVDANQAATVADFTTGTGIVLISWGDGSAPLPLDASNLTAVGTPNGVVWSITAAHTYTEEGSYSYTISVRDTGGSFTTVTGTAIVADAALTAGPPVAISETTGVPFTNVVVGDFTDANTGAPASDFTAVIQWGDGTPTSLGTVVATATPGAFNVEGSHVYAHPGAYAISIVVTDDGGSRVTLTATAGAGTITVTDLPVTGARPQLHGRRGPGHRHDRAGDFRGSQHPGHRRQRACDPARWRLGRWHADGDHHPRGHPDRRRPDQRRPDLRRHRQPHLCRRRNLHGQHQRHDLGRRDHGTDAGHRHDHRRQADRLCRHRDHRHRG